MLPPATAPGAATAAVCTKACCGSTWGLLDRFRLMEVGYPEPAEEMQSWPGPCRPCRPPWRTRWSGLPTKPARSSSAAKTVPANCRSPCPRGDLCAGHPWRRPSRVRRTPSPIPWDKRWQSAPNPPSAPLCFGRCIRRFGLNWINRQLKPSLAHWIYPKSNTPTLNSLGCS